MGFVPRINLLKWEGLSFVIFLTALYFLAQSSTLLATGNSYYVAPNGNDSNPGTINQPFRTAQRGVNAASCGDTVYLRAGTYDGGVGTNQRCTSWNNALTLRSYPGELVTLINTGQETIFGFGTKSYPSREDIYFVLQGVVLDAARGSSTSLCAAGLSVDHVRLQDVECKNAQREGIIPHGRFWELLNVNSHDNGLDQSPSHPRGHGVYLTDGNCLIDGGSYHDNGGYGIQIFDSGSITNSNNVVRNARIFRNNLNTSASPLIGNGGGGIVLANGTNNVIYNSVLYGNGATNIQINGTCLQCGVYNNTEFGGYTGLQIVDRFATGTIVRNNIFFGNVGQAISDSGTGSIFSNNLTSDPRFTNSAIGDFTLQSSSSAIDAGANVSSVLGTDFRGASRPAGSAFDIGAYEFGSQPPADGVLPTVSVKASH
jgi:hypothetical protein